MGRIAKIVFGLGFFAGGAFTSLSQARSALPAAPPPTTLDVIHHVAFGGDWLTTGAALFALVSAILTGWQILNPGASKKDVVADGEETRSAIKENTEITNDISGQIWAEGQQRDAQHDANLAQHERSRQVVETVAAHQTAAIEDAFAKQIADLKAAIDKGTNTKDLIEDLSERLRKRELSQAEMEQIAGLYGLFLRRSSDMNEVRIESAVKGISHDPSLLEKALLDLEGQERATLLEAAEGEIREDRTNLAARTRNLAGFAAAESLTRARRLWLEAADLDPTDFWQWIELSRLAQISVDEGGLERAKHFAERAGNHINNERDRMVAEAELGKIAVASGALGEARIHFTNCVNSAKARVDEEPGNAGWQRDLSVSYNKLGDIEVAAGNLAMARKHFENSLAIRKTLADGETGNAGWQRDLSVSYEKLGDIEVAAGNITMARTHFEKALTIFKKLADDEPSNAGWQRDLWVSHVKLGQLAEREGDAALSLKHFREAERVMAALAEKWPDHPGFANDLAAVRSIISDLENPRGDG